MPYSASLSTPAKQAGRMLSSQKSWWERLITATCHSRVKMKLHTRSTIILNQGSHSCSLGTRSKARHRRTRPKNTLNKNWFLTSSFCEHLKNKEDNKQAPLSLSASPCASTSTPQSTSTALSDLNRYPRLSFKFLFICTNMHVWIFICTD